MKKPLRTCLITRKKYIKNDLFRFIVINENVFLDQNKIFSGRGFYLVRDIDSIEEFINKNLFSKVLKLKKILTEEEKNNLMFSIKTYSNGIKF